MKKEGVAAEVNVTLDGFYLNESSDFLYLASKENKRVFDSHLPETLSEVDPMCM